MSSKIMDSAGSDSSSVALEATITPFLKKLLSLSSSLPNEIGGWDDEGKVFVVFAGPAFESHLRNYFKGTLQTFVRQLHFYGFSKTDLPRLGQSSWSFSHPFFQRDAPHLIAEIKRKCPPSKQVKAEGADNGMNEFGQDGADSGKTARLEEEVKELKERVKSLEETVAQLLQYTEINGYAPASKKAKLLDDDQSVSALESKAFEGFEDFMGLPFMDPINSSKEKGETAATPDIFPEEVLKDIQLSEDFDLSKTGSSSSATGNETTPVSWQQQFLIAQRKQFQAYSGKLV